MDWQLIILIATFIMALFAVIGAIRNRSSIHALVLARRRDGQLRNNEIRHEHSAHAAGPAYVIYNPTKNVDWLELRDILSRTARDASFDEPVWLPTTADDPGSGQAREAIDAGASVVIAAGGDGTVRAIAHELAGSNIPLGLLPCGTGNLLARNLNFPIDDPRELAVIALTGKTRTIDVGKLTVGELTATIPSGKRAQKLSMAAAGEYTFVVNAGMGLDAAIMAQADNNKKLKEKIGWAAYFTAAMPHILAPKMEATLQVGNAGQPVTTTARTVMFLNCGELIGGLVLDSSAKTDDGWIELAIVDTKAGLIGWVDLLRRQGLRGIGVKKVDIPGVPAQGELDIHRIREADLTTVNAHPIQVDGEVLGYANQIRAQIIPGALNVRVRS